MSRHSGRLARRALLALALPFIVAALAAGCDGGGSGGSTTSSATGQVGPAGGTVAITSGSLAGTTIDVPAGALSSDVTITIDGGPDLSGAVAGASAAGAAVSIEPGATSLSVPVTITLLTSGVPAGTPLEDVVVLVSADGGATVTVLSPLAVDFTGGLVTVTSPTLGAFQVAVLPRDPDASATITIAVQSASISEEGEATDAVVTRAGDVSRQVVIQLAASPDGVLSIPPQVTILAGEATARFVVTGANNKLLDGTKPALITATLSGATPSACAIEVVSGDVDEAPVADALAIATDEDTPTAASLTATDVNEQPITYSIVTGGAKGTATVIDASNGAFTYVPDQDANGDDSFTFKATANGLDSQPVTVTVTIAPINDGPLGAAGSLTVTEDLGAAGTLAGTDVEGDALTFAVASQGAKGTVTILDASAGTYSYAPLANTNGADVFTFTVSDAELTSAAQTIAVSITAVNDPPVASPGTVSTSEDTAQIGSLAASDVDSAIAGYEVVSLPGKGALSLVTATGAFTFTPTLNLNGADSFTFRAIDSDSSAPSNVTAVSISIAAVNDVPVAASGTLSTSEDTPANGALAATDVDSAIAGYEIVSGPGKGAISLVTATGAFTFTPTLNLNGADSFTFRAIDSDSAAPSSVTTVTITIGAVNDAPVAAAASISLLEDAPHAATLVATDVDSAVASYQIVSAPAKGVISLVTATGAYTYTPLSNTNGADAFTFRAIDSDSAAPSNTTQVSVAITAVNDAPTLDAIGDVTIAEDAGLQQIVLTGITRGPLDEAGQTLSITASSGDTVVIPTPSISYIGGATTGTLSYAPAANQYGLVTITVTAQDDGLTANGGADTRTRTFTISVTAVNDVPLAANRNYGVARNVTATVDAATGLLQPGFVSDADPTDSLSAVLVGGPSFGTLTSFNADGSFAFQPPQDVTGTATFQYRVFDGVTHSAVATVSMQISSDNGAPTAVADGLFSTSEDTTLNVVAPGLLANDTDPDGDSLTAETVTAVPGGQGALTLNPDGSLSFVPAANFFGPVSFTYRARDPFGATSAAATVSITVTSVNDPPTFTVQDGTGARIFAEDSGANVITITGITPGNTFEAAAGETVSLTAIVEGASPSNLFSGFSVGTVGQSTVTTNAITLTPAANVFGTASLRIRVTDQLASSSSDVVISLTVSNVNDLPDFNAVTPTAQEDTLASITVNTITAGANESDLVSVAAELVSETTPGLVPSLGVAPSGLQSAATNRAVSFTPGTDLNGSAQIRITATDNGTPATSTAKVVTVVVGAVNDAPIFTNATGAGPFNITENSSTTTISLTGIRPGPATATDEAASQTTVVTAEVQTQSPGGLVTGLAVTTPTAQTPVAINSVTFAPASNTTGTATIRVRVTDSAAAPLSTTASISYTVVNVNDAPDFAAIGGRVTNEDTPLAINVTGITAGPNDPDTLTLTVTTANASPANLLTSFSVTPGTLGASGGGATINLSPRSDLNGGVDVTFRVQDNGTGSLFKEETFHVTVTAVNDGATADDVDMETQAGVAVEIPLSGNDIETGQTGLTFEVVSAPSGANGSVNIVGSTATYTPAGGFASLTFDTFTYRAKDPSMASSGVATVRVFRTLTQKRSSPMADITGVTPNANYSWPLPATGTIGGLAMASAAAGFDESQVQGGDALVTNGSQLFLSPARKLAASPVAVAITSALTGAAGVAYDSLGNRAVIAFNNGYGVVSLGSFDSDTGTLTPTQVTVGVGGGFKAIAFDDEAAPSFVFIASPTQIRRVTLNGSLGSASPAGTQLYTGASIGAIACRINGDLYFVEGSAIKVLPGATSTTETATTLVTSVTAAGTVGAIVFNSVGNLLVAVNSTSGSDFIREYHPVSVNTILNTRTYAAGSNPAFIAIDRNFAAVQWSPTTAGAPNLKTEVIVGATLSGDAFPRLLQAGCNGCHYDAAGITSFAASFSAWSASEFRLKVRDINAACAGTPLVSTAAPTSSLIPTKLSFGTASCNAEGRMPQGGPFFTETEIELLRSWIRAGAPNN